MITREKMPMTLLLTATQTLSNGRIMVTKRTVCRLIRYPLITTIQTPQTVLKPVKVVTSTQKNRAKFRGATVTGAYVSAYDNYEGDTLQEKIYNYLSNEIGIPTSQLDFIIDYLTE
jgi:hypothetical protein